eukprot:CAMPEP_0117445846 /NCGR_PEP_ID=MMETSP0759-20121206/6017_1 /TAXON_ID=63605 /ORGANISM="Percolomonas cosmopolitus, Strain WS" /LENGTH=888 /DNA_ID=CAMNT_0005238057 /DNA_START=218 /DNA_END=2881 /DNA_ORIENTATION=-
MTQQHLSPASAANPSSSPNAINSSYQYKNISLRKKRPLSDLSPNGIQNNRSPHKNKRRHSVNQNGGVPRSSPPHPNVLSRKANGALSMPAALWGSLRASPRHASPNTGGSGGSLSNNTADSAASVASRNITTPSKKYLPSISSAHQNESSPTLSQKSRHHIHPHLSPHLSLTHPHEKYELSPTSTYSNLASTSDISSRLASIEKGLARQLEAYIERERDLFHRLKVTNEDNKKIKRESDRLRERHHKLIEDLKDTKAKAVEMVKNVEEKFMSQSSQRREQEAKENITNLDAQREHLEEHVRTLTQEVHTRQRQVEEKEREMERMKIDRIEDLERQQEEINRKEAQINHMRREIENERLILKTKESLMIEQDEHYQHMLLDVERRERDVDQRVKDELKKETKIIKEQLQKEFDAKLQLLQDNASFVATPSTLTPGTSSLTSQRRGSVNRSGKFKLAASNIIRLVYISKGIMLEESDLRRLEEPCIERNTRHDISSILFHQDNDPTLIQVIEGPEASVNALYANLHNDARHFDVVCVRIESFVPERFCEGIPFRVSRIHSSMSFESRDILNRFYSYLLQQYAVVHRYAPPLILEPVRTGQTEILANVTTSDKVILYVEIMVAAPHGGTGSKLFDLEPEKPMRAINRVLRLCQNAVAKNGGTFVSFTPSLGMVSVFEENDTEKAADAALFLLSTLKEEFDNAQEEADDELAEVMNDESMRPFTSRNIAVTITKGSTCFGNVGSHDSMMFTAVGPAVALAQHLAHAMPEEYCLVFDSTVSKQLANPFFPKYSKIVTTSPVHTVQVVQKRGRTGTVKVHSLTNDLVKRPAPLQGANDRVFSKFLNTESLPRSTRKSPRSARSSGRLSMRGSTSGLSIDTNAIGNDSSNGGDMW